MDKYQPTIGLEIHAELKTRTKMFCDSLNDPDPSTSLGAGEKHPNTNVCPVCLGHPGTLPTINRQAVEHVIKVGLALGGKINPITKFDRKNYFYPDLPKGYQISQYDQPLVLGGELNGVRIRRVHLEEDTGTLIHETRSTKHDTKERNSGVVLRASSLVDFNRAGVPLMELVTEPDLKSAEEVVAFAKELQLILRYLGVSDADMEKGQLRIEANVSISQSANSESQMGQKVELKNINSFRFAKEAIEYEVKRQAEALEKGEKIVQETRGWDESKKRTVSQRSKEEAHDYRYFPEPDLPPIHINVDGRASPTEVGGPLSASLATVFDIGGGPPTEVFEIERLKAELPELPAAKRERFAREYALDQKQIEVFVGDPKFAEFFEEAASELKAQNPKYKSDKLVGYLINDLRSLLNESGVSWGELKISPEHMGHLIALIEGGTIGSKQAKEILRKMFETGIDPEEVVKIEDLETVSDEGELGEVVKDVLEENETAVVDYKKGKTASMQFLVGKAMQKTKGRGNPAKLKEFFEKVLG